MHEDILYSVLIPAYNAETYLEECLDSVLCQTHRNLQVVVIDDGSTDRTAEILDGYVAKDSRLEVVHRENRGVATTRLELFKMAKGNYLNFVDADDTVEPEMAQVMIDVLESTYSDMAVCGMTNKMERSFMHSQAGDLKIEKISGTQARREFLEHRRLVGALWNKVIRRDVCVEVNCPPDIRYGEDAVMSWHILKHTSSLVYLSAPLYHYRVNRESISQRAFGVSKMTGLMAWRYLEDRMCEEDPSMIDLLRAQQCNQAAGLLYDMYKGGHVNLNWSDELRKTISSTIRSFNKESKVVASISRFVWINLVVICWPMARLLISARQFIHN